MLVSVVACCRYNNVVMSLISSFGLWVVPQIALHRYLIVDDGCCFFCSLLGFAKTANAVCSVSLVRVIRCNRCFIKLRVWVQGQFRAKPILYIVLVVVVVTVDSLRCSHRSGCNSWSNERL
jgi:hypothetical protein